MKFRNRPSANRGVALVITLAMIVMLTFVVVAFFSRTVTNRQIESASAGGTRAEILGKSAADTIVSDLQTEIIAGSTVLGTGAGTRIYKPLSAVNMLPAISRGSGFAANDPASVNLLKQSTGRFFPSTADYPNGTPIIQSTTGLATTAPSQNRRVVSNTRWDDPRRAFPSSGKVLIPSGPMLLGGSPPFTFSRLYNDQRLPQWVLVTRAGIPAVQTWNAAYKNYSPDNSQAVIGRFAFNVYDQGGLLDVNVAGFPNGIPDRALAQKGTLGLAQLAAIPGIDTTANAALFVGGWRNLASGTDPNDYLAYLGFAKNGATDLTGNVFFNSGPKNGFRKMAAGSASSDNRILGRQDLIRLVTKGSGAASTYGISPAALPYLTHFTRELNAPTWSPATAPGSSIDYAAQAENSAAANRFLPNVRSVGTFTRPDGSSVVAGDPLIKSRFPLDRLASVGVTGVSPTALVLNGGSLQPATAATVQRDFGLVWNPTSSQWEYVGSTGTTIQTTVKTLAQVANENREPNFFELLKAGVLAGSLGKSGGNTLAVTDAQDGNQDNQIIQIGANIIDQADANNFPTEIAFAGVNFYGVENLPYLNELFPKTYWPGFNKNDIATNVKPVNCYLAAELWNPHLPDVTPVPGPTKIRFTTGQSASFRLLMARSSVDAIPPAITPPNQSSYPDGSIYQPIPGYKGDGTANLVLDGDITPASYREPTLMNSNAGDPGYQPDVLSGALVLPPVANTKPWPDTWFDGKTKAAWGVHQYASTMFMLQYFDDATGKYRTYATMAGFPATDSTIGNFGNYIDITTTPGLTVSSSYAKSDPRTTRFGYGMAFADSLPVGVRINRSWNPTGNAADERIINQGKPNFATGFVPDKPGCPLGQLMTNKLNGLTYADRDALTRPADHNLDAISGVNSPFLSNDPGKIRPVVLNRPFRSVGELGYVFRDQPWKTLDLFSKLSGDAGLLDLFTVNETAVPPLNNVTAGRLNLNTKNKPVLQAVIAGAGKSEAVSPATISLADAGTLADEILLMSSGTGGPFINRAELVTRLASTTVDAAAHPAVKTQREAAIRALAEVGTTRTWTLLIDVIAQSGKYPQNAGALGEFIVEGEKRYWLHVAIDRYTGQVIDRMLEPVLE